MSCAVCADAAARYKCRCAARTPYCSASCFKAHKASSCRAEEEAAEARLAARKAREEAEARAAAEAAARPPAGGVTERTQGKNRENLSEAQLRALAGTAAVRDALSSAELRRIIESVDSAEDRPRRLELVLANNPDFAAFTNDVLRAIGHRSDAMAVGSEAARRAVVLEQQEQQQQ